MSSPEKQRIKMSNVSVYLREIGDEIKRGTLGIPLWQRRFVWNAEQVLELFDSIRHGYPIGSFLLWSRDENWKGSLGILSSEINLDAKPKSYILDGRQRITAFYGCTSQTKDKAPIFNLYYDLRQEIFCYPTAKKEVAHILKVSDIFDTFILLGCLQQIQQAYEPETARTYIDRAKELNSQLQEYVVSKITIGDCDLDEATIAFSRLNSKGTDISKTEMMQAICYTGNEQDLLVPAFEQLLTRLSTYGFEGLSHDEILNCYLLFDGRSVFDTGIKDLESARNIIRHKQAVEEAVTSSARFLYEHCGVISIKLLPYRRQFLSLVSFFRHNSYETLTQDKISELKQWFFYTSLNKTFQNSSLGVVRNLFSNFENYALGKSSSPLTYDGLYRLDEESFTFSSTSALFKLMMICLISHYSKITGKPFSELNYQGHCHFGSKNPAVYFPLIHPSDKGELNKLFNGSYIKIVEEDELKPYCLDANMLETYNEGDISKFEQLRKQELLKVINNRLSEVLTN